MQSSKDIPSFPGFYNGRRSVIHTYLPYTGPVDSPEILYKQSYGE